MNNSGFTYESSTNQTIEWYTPPEIFDALNVIFDLDPCSAGENNDFVPCVNRFTIKDDGLSREWHGLVWMNPPYGRQTSTWMNRLADHNNGIALVFSRTDTEWFRKNALKASAICFINKRVNFYRGDTRQKVAGSPTGSMLMAFGDRARTIVIQSGLGVCMESI